MLLVDNFPEHGDRTRPLALIEQSTERRCARDERAEPFVAFDCSAQSARIASGDCRK